MTWPSLADADVEMEHPVDSFVRKTKLLAEAKR